MRDEEPGKSPVLEEEEGRRWLSRTETLDSCLWGRLETEEADPGLWRERREEDRPSPNRGDKCKKGRIEGREKRRERRRRKKRNKGWSREEKHMKYEYITEMVSRGDAARKCRQVRVRGKGVVREVCACVNVSEKHGCVQWDAKNDSLRHVGGSARGQTSYLIQHQTNQSHNTTEVRQNSELREACMQGRMS